MKGKSFIKILIKTIALEYEVFKMILILGCSLENLIFWTIIIKKNLMILKYKSEKKFLHHCNNRMMLIIILLMILKIIQYLI